MTVGQGSTVLAVGADRGFVRVGERNMAIIFLSSNLNLFFLL